jgi:membrane-bound lytic murein transglycosylase D
MNLKLQNGCSVLAGNDIFARLKSFFTIELNLQKINIRLKLFVIFVLSVFSYKIMAQTDSIWIAYKTQYRTNLMHVNDLYCWSDAGFYPGKFKFTSTLNFQTEYEKQKPILFPLISNYAEDFYLFLESLNTTEKQNLVRLFYFYEKGMEASLKSAGLPDELKYLAPALSAMNPTATNWDGKAGVFQLSHFQAVMNGMQINKLVDERLNPSLSMPAFAAVMKQNLETFKNLELAVLGYLFGNAKVKNAISFAGENVPISQVLSYLPETASLVIGAFQATSIFLNENQFKTTIDPLAKKILPDTAHISSQLHFQQVSKVLGISEKQLGFLNPQYRFHIVPGDKFVSKLVIPDGYWDEFVLFRDSIYNAVDSTLFAVAVQKIEYAPAPGRQYLGEPVKNLEIEGKTKIKYKLQTGDVLGVIAEKYDVEVADLKYWNNISNERKIQAGKTLDIFVDNDKVDEYASLQKTTIASTVKTPTPKQIQQNTTLAVLQEMNTGNRVEYTVKNGESPFTIAKKYDGVSPEDILKWNNIADAGKIQIGQKLIIYTSK